MVANHPGSPTPRYSVAEIAAVLGVTRNAVQRRANREAWPFEEQTTRGGWRRLYSEQALPRAIARKMAAHAAINAVKKAKGSISEAFVVVIGGEVFEVRRLPV